MSDGVRIRVGAGNVVSGAQLRQVVERAMDPALKRAGLAMQASEQQAAPLGPTGNLKRSAATSPPEWAGSSVRRVRVGFGAVYARRVNLTSRRNKGYIERGFAAGRERALGEVRRGVSALIRELWVNK